jgi:hypothetical protein
MYFGMSNAPGAFQVLMNEIFKDMIVACLIVIYLDDILIFSKTREEHIKVTKKVLARLRKHDLYLKLEKCDFNKKETEFLGIIITDGQIKMDPIKLKGVADWPAPAKLKEVQAFMGFANFYQRFINGFSEIARPLNNLAKKNNPWKWEEEQQKAFKQLKKRFMEGPVLKMPDPGKQYRIKCDASNYATGAILSQQYGDEWHPVAYQSKSFNETEQNYEIHDKELAAIIRALEAWQHYLEGQGILVEIWTDHKNLEYFMKSQNITRRQARWALFLSWFDFTLCHKPGKLSTKPDTLSQRADHFANDASDNRERIILGPDKIKIMATQRGHATITGEKTILKRIRELQNSGRNEDIGDALYKLDHIRSRSLKKGLEDWNVEDRLVLYKGKVYIPHDDQLRTDII